MSGRQSSGVTLIEVLVVVLLIALLVSIIPASCGRASPQAKSSFCAHNLGQFMRAVHMYASEYKSFPPHNPLPGYWPSNHPVVRVHGAGFDPSIGFLMTYTMLMTTPARFANDHFQWFVLTEDELPDIVICPEANRKLLFEPNPEIDTLAPWETFVYQYAAFYQTSGTIRAATATQVGIESDQSAVVSRNPAFPDLSSPAAARPCRNAVRRMPGVRISPSWTATAPSGSSQPPNSTTQQTALVECWVQAVRPDEIDNPRRVYYMADSREYRVASDHPDSDLPATTNDGWLTTGDGRVLLGARHNGVANVSYMDGHVSRDGLSRDPAWNLDYDPKTRQARSPIWRASTFADSATVTGLGNQHHLLPALALPGSQDLSDTADTIAR